MIDFQENYVSRNDNVVSSFHIDKDGKYYVFLVNLGDKETVEVKRKGFKNLLIDGVVYPCTLNLDKYESKIVYFTNDEYKLIEKKAEISLDDGFIVKNTNSNFLNIDTVCFSKDGLSYSKPYPTMFVLDKLIKEKYQGGLFLKYSFGIQCVPTICNALIEDTRISKVFVNGNLVEKIGFALEKDLLKYDIVKFLKKGLNDIVVKIDFYEKEAVFAAIYGENVTESLKNCLAYDTTIEPIYLEGNFGVFGDFQESNNCYIANKFFIGKQPSMIKTFVTDGFPFFRGDIVLSKKVNVSQTNLILKIKNRFQLVEVRVNGQYVETLMFKNFVDLAKYLKIGENEIELVYTVSNRNLLGPHHSVNEEPFGVGPETFERFKTWDKEGNSPLYKKRYSFVKVL